MEHNDRLMLCVMNSPEELRKAVRGWLADIDVLGAKCERLAEKVIEGNAEQVELRRRVDSAVTELRALKGTQKRCVFCGWNYENNDEDAIRAHWHNCTGHPAHAVIAELRNKVQGWEDVFAIKSCVCTDCNTTLEHKDASEHWRACPNSGARKEVEALQQRIADHESNESVPKLAAGLGIFTCLHCNESFVGRYRNGLAQEFCCRECQYAFQRS